MKRVADPFVRFSTQSGYVTVNHAEVSSAVAMNPRQTIIRMKSGCIFFVDVEEPIVSYWLVTGRFDDEAGFESRIEQFLRNKRKDTD